MSRWDKIAADFKHCSGPYPYADLVRLLKGLGYTELSTGGGSKRKFVHSGTRHIIRLHEPHPGKEILPYLVRQIREQLIERGLI
jgi:predicted RNA binding protein YcfA (HicA-like mRNA interferase family)